METIFKKTFPAIVMLFALMIGSTSYGQGNPQNRGQQGPPPIPNTKEIKKMVSDLADEISLSEELEAKMLDLHVAHFKEVREKTSSGRPNREEMESLRTDFETEVKSLLTEEQQEQYDDYRKKNHPRRKKS